jgi:hypothetical protein
VIANLKVGKVDYNPKERQRISSNKGLARNIAFQLLYLILHPYYRDKTKDKIKLFNAVMFIVSYLKTFKYYIKQIIRVVYKWQFGLTVK